MRYLTHLLLHQLSTEAKPDRQLRDNFGLDTAACFCCHLKSHATPASHCNADAYKASQSTFSLDHSNNRRSNTASSGNSSISSATVDIELSVLQPAHAKANVREGAGALHVSDGASEWASEVQSAWLHRTRSRSRSPLPLPQAHCRTHNRCLPPSPIHNNHLPSPH